MTMSWNDVVADDRYQTLSDADKSDVRKQYFENIVAKDPRYEGLPDADKLDVQKKFFGDNVPQGYVDQAFQRTKEFFVDKPAEGAAVLRGAATDAIAPTEDAITAQAAQTGDVPYAKIAARTAVSTATDLIPLTPTEIAGYVLGGRLLSEAGGLATKLAERFPNVAAVLTKINNFGRTAQTVEEKSLGLASRMVDDMKAPEPAKPGAAQTPGVPPTEAPPDAAAVGDAAPSPAAPLPQAPTPEVPVPPKLQDEIAAKSPDGAVPVTPVPTPAIPNIDESYKLPEKDVFGQQLAKFDTWKTAKAAINETSNLIKDTIKPDRLKTVSVEDTKTFADLMGWDYDTLIKNRGRAFLPQELHAAQGLTTASAQELDDAIKAYRAAPTPENMVAAQLATAKHALVQQTFLEARAEAGRSLNILKLATKARAGTVEAGQIGQANIDKITEAMGGKDVSEEFVKRLAMLNPQNMSEVNAFARNVFKATTADKVYEVYMNSILSSPATLIRNTLGNASFLASKVPEKVFRGATDAIAGAFTGQRTAYAGEAIPEMVGLFQGLKDATRVGLRRLISDADEQQVTKLDLNRLPEIQGKLGKFIRTPTRILTATDEFFKTLIRRSELNAQAYRAAKQEGLKGDAFLKRVAEIIDQPTPTIQKAVDDEALYRSFQNENKVARGLMTFRNSINPVGKYVLPFLRTPVNIAARGVERTPLGAIKVAADIFNRSGQEVLSKDVGNLAMGSIMASTVAALTLEGKIIGAAPKDKNKRDAFFRSGKIPYSVKIGDTYHSYSAFEPLSMVLGATSDVVNLAREKGQDPDANITAAIPAAIGRYMVSKTFLSGLRDVIDGVSDPERFGMNLANTLASGLVPASGLMRYIAAQIDPFVRQVDNPADAVKSITPWISRSLAPKVNVYGEDVRRPEGLVIQQSKARFNPLDQEDEMLNRETGFVDQKMGSVKLTNDEYVALLKDRGDMLKNARLDFRKDQQWDQLSDEDKRNTINRLQDAAALEAKLGIYEKVLRRLKPGDKRDKFIEYGVNSLGLDPKELLAITGGNGGAS